MFEYGLIDLLVDLAIFGPIGTDRPPNRHRASFTPQEVDRLVDGMLEQLMHPNLPMLHNAAANPQRAAFQNALGKKSWEQLEAEATRVRDIVKKVSEGFSPAELESLYANGAAKEWVANYARLANHAASKQHGNAELVTEVDKLLPDIKSRLGAFVREGTEPGTLHELLGHSIPDEALRGTAQRASVEAQHTVRQVNQAATAGFSNWKNFKTSIGSAAKFKHWDASMLFYGGAAGMAHVGYQVFQPKRDGTPENQGRHSWNTITIEGMASMAALITGLVMAGHRTDVK